MSCTPLSLFTNVTVEPTDTVTDCGDAPLDVMVIVVSVAGVGAGAEAPDPTTIGVTELRGNWLGAPGQNRYMAIAWVPACCSSN